MSELRDNLINNEIEKLNNAYLNKINIDDLNGNLNFEFFLKGKIILKCRNPLKS